LQDDPLGAVWQAGATRSADTLSARDAGGADFGEKRARLVRFALVTDDDTRARIRVRAGNGTPVATLGGLSGNNSAK